jgi:hypothetical protein
MPRNTRKRQPKPSRDSRTLVNPLKPQQTPIQAAAEMMVGGLATNAVTAVGFSKIFGELDLSECVTALATVTQRVNGGDLSNAEALLTAQSVVLNTIFTELARRSMLNMGEYLDAADRYMRLALKAQGQCRATIETLALMKNPPTVFARQANIANGPQQVNNTLNRAEPASQSDLARAEISEIGPNELLEGHGERLDTGAKRTTARGDQAVATVGTVNRPKDRRGQSAVFAERRQRRAAAVLSGAE